MIYAILIMTAINFYARGTQDLYPTPFCGCSTVFCFHEVSKIAIVYSTGAALWLRLVASLSQKIRTAPRDVKNRIRVAVHPCHSALGVFR